MAKKSSESTSEHLLKDRSANVDGTPFWQHDSELILHFYWYQSYCCPQIIPMYKNKLNFKQRIEVLEFVDFLNEIDEKNTK